jgi:hypothetical protein
MLSPEVTGITPPQTIEQFTDLVLDLRRRIGGGLPPEPVAVEPGNLVRAELRFTNYLHHDNINFRFLPRPGGPPPQRTGGEQVVAVGRWHRMDRAQFTDDVAVVRYPFTLSTEREVLIMFNTSEQTQVWVDDDYLFARETGGMGEPAAVTPALHCPPIHQYAVRRLPAGKHEIVALVRRPVVDRIAEWVVGVGDPVSGMWVPGAFQFAE